MEEQYMSYLVTKCLKSMPLLFEGVCLLKIGTRWSPKNTPISEADILLPAVLIHQLLPTY